VHNKYTAAAPRSSQPLVPTGESVERLGKKPKEPFPYYNRGEWISHEAYSEYSLYDFLSLSLNVLYDFLSLNVLHDFLSLSLSVCFLL